MTNPKTKYILLKVTYDSYFHEPPETWDWNQLIESGQDENVEIVRVSDIPIGDQEIF